MATRTIGASRLDARVLAHLQRRTVPIAVAVVYVGLGLAYCFRWGSVVRHTPSLWISPGDLSDIYRASSAAAHGHFGAIYQAKSAFLAFPGILIALLPLGALNNVFHTTFVEITKNHHLLTHPQFLLTQTPRIWGTGTITSGANRANEYSVQPQWFAFVAPYALLLSCTALFACDALAERLLVTGSRRVVLSLAEAVVLWPVVTFWGHPEDPVAVALAVYALLCAMDRRLTRAGWLFGAAVAVQPLVVVMFPILLVLGGKTRALGLIVRGAVPAAAVIAAPLVADFHATVHAVVVQPGFPDLKGNHQTPWTFLAPKLSGKGTSTTIGGGPIRVTALAFAAGVGLWARRWRDKPEMLVWAAALALALRSYTESVMTAYYAWPALAVGLVVAALGSSARFRISIALAVGVTVLAQWQLGVLPWWVIDVGGVTGLLVVAARPGAPAGVEPAADRRRAQVASATPSRARSTGSDTKKQAAKRKAARTDRKRSARR